MEAPTGGPPAGIHSRNGGAYDSPRTQGADSERLPAFVQDPQVGVVDKDAVASLAGVFAGDTGGDQVQHTLRRGRKVHGGGSAYLPEGKHRAFSKGGEHPQGVGSPATEGLNPAGVLPEERHEVASRFHRAQRRVLHAFEKKVHPRLPIAPGADAVEQIVVGGPVLFEVKAQVKQWLSEERNNCGSGSRVPMLSSRPSACMARCKSRCRPLESPNDGAGGNGIGTNALTASPPIDVTESQPDLKPVDVPLRP